MGRWLVLLLTQFAVYQILWHPGHLLSVFRLVFFISWKGGAVSIAVLSPLSPPTHGQTVVVVAERNSFCGRQGKITETSDHSFYFHDGLVSVLDRKKTFCKITFIVSEENCSFMTAPRFV